MASGRVPNITAICRGATPDLTKFVLTGTVNPRTPVLHKCSVDNNTMKGAKNLSRAEPAGLVTKGVPDSRNYVPVSSRHTACMTGGGVASQGLVSPRCWADVQGHVHL